MYRSLRVAMLATAALFLAACLPELIADAGPDQTVAEGDNVKTDETVIQLE